MPGPNLTCAPPWPPLQGGGQHLQLAASLVQAMFPPISVQKVKLSACQRVVLLSHDKASGLISLRHYSISTAPSGIKKSLKALLAKRALPGDMGSMRDVSELVTKSGYGSVSAWWRDEGWRGAAWEEPPAVAGLGEGCRGFWCWLLAGGASASGDSGPRGERQAELLPAELMHPLPTPNPTPPRSLRVRTPRLAA